MNRLVSRHRGSHHVVRVLLGATALVGTVFGLASGPAGAGVANRARTYNLSLVYPMPSFDDLPLQIMLNEGIARRFHLNLTVAAAAPLGTQASSIFATGTGDILVGGLDAVVSLDEHLAGSTTVIGTLDPRGLWTLVSKRGTPYRTLASLKGQSVGIPSPGGFSQFALIQALHGVHMSPSDVNFAALGGAPSQYAALLGGSAAAVELQPPTLENAIASGTVQVIYDFEKVTQPSMLFSARTTAVKADPAAYAAFMRALAYTTNRLMTDRNWAWQMALDAFGSSTTATDLNDELSTFVSHGLWSRTGKFTRTLYVNGATLLSLSNAFPAIGFPTYRQLTQATPRF